MTSAAIRILIVGHGVAGVTAAQAARAQDGAAQITIAGEEPHGAYYRVRLSHDLATGIDPGASGCAPRPGTSLPGSTLSVARG